MAAHAPPQAVNAMVVGNVRVPTLKMALVGADGKFQTHEMVELSRTHGGTALFKWLFEPLGFTYDDWSHGLPWKLPLLTELRSGLKNPGGTWKRGRDKKLRDERGNPMSEVVPLHVRDRDIQLHNTPGHLRLILSEPLSDVNWLCAELWHDRQHFAPVREEGARGNPMPMEVRKIIDDVLGKIGALPQCHRALLDAKHGRVRIWGLGAHGEQLKVQYVPIKEFRKLLDTHTVDPEHALEELRHATDAAFFMAEAKLAVGDTPLGDIAEDGQGEHGVAPVCDIAPGGKENARELGNGVAPIGDVAHSDNECVGG